MAGYSGTPLPKKLGIKEGMTVSMLHAPDHFEFDGLPNDVTIHRTETAADVYLIFETNSAKAEADFRRAMDLIPADGAIWVAWPKKASGVDTDITGNVLRDLLLPTGMVDNKVCAIDDTWSGLRFVVRKENRSDWPS